MQRHSTRVIATAVTGAIALVGLLSGCGGGKETTATPRTGETTSVPATTSAPVSPGEDADTQARTTVQNYLDAMKTKDVAKGKAQMCPALRDTFDQVATGPNGDFAKHFVLKSAKVDKVEKAGENRKVTASLSLQANSGETKDATVVYTAQTSGGGWCISNEAVA
jgi:hypothetical protein